jgi:23S rRNA (uridine2552-2'-O)-methyltransferase
MSRLDDRRNRQDIFYRRAKQEHFAARSVYKLQELDQRFRLLCAGQRVLDLGCRPGSWLQYCAAKVGSNGFVVGLDREPLEVAVPDNAAVLVGDVLQLDPPTYYSALPGQQHSCFHLVLSDMAPDTSGVSFADQVHSVELVSRALHIAARVGCPQSNFVAKVFMGEGFSEIVKEAKQHYARTKTVRPEATRKSSTELYLVALEKKR